MDEALINNHNELVGVDDTTIHLGDFSLSSTVTQNVLPKLNGKHILISGNHDKSHPCHKKRKTIQEYLDFGFQEVVTEKVMEIDGLGLIKLNHLPYQDPKYENIRYNKFKPRPNKEKYLFHGHVHNSWKQNGNMLNLGVDVWNYKPVSLETIINYLNSNI